MLPMPKPSRISRAWEVIRSSWTGPLTSRSPELARLLGGNATASSGVSITELSALNLSAVWAAVGLISDDVASLPLFLYRRTPTGGKDRYEAHPLYRLLHDEPNAEMTSMVLRRTMQSHALIWGNAFAEIERDGGGRPVALWPLLPECVRVERDRVGTLVYRYHNPSGGDVTYPSRDMIHLVGRGHDGSVGASLVSHARESFGLALAAEQFGSTFFGNGATFGGVISFKGPKPPEMSEANYRDALEARHQGVKRAHKLLALYNDATFKETGTAPNNAQFLETRTFQIREVARWFKVPPHKLADLADATFSNVEQMNTEYFVSAIRPWLVLWEQELTRKLVSPLERRQQFIEHSIEGFLRGDSSARAAFYTSLFNIGAITINEVRGYENLDPLDGGDQSFVQVNNLMPLSMVQEHAEAMIAALEAKSSPEPPPEPEPADDEGEDVQVMAAKLDGIEARFVEHADRLAAEAAKSAALEQQLRAAAQDAESLRAELAQSAQTVADRDAAIIALDARRQQELSVQEGQTAEQLAARTQAWAAERAVLVAAQAEALAAKNDLDVMLGAADAARAETEAARLEALTLAAQERQTRERRDAQTGDRLLQIRLAHRALIVDAVQRLIHREADRARKAQATPAKLLAWVDQFYPLHVETCRAILRPVVLAWAPCAGVSPDDTLRDLVAAHIEQSRRDLRLAADAEDADDLAANLARTLHRWDTERADAVADALLAEGERYGH